MDQYFDPGSGVSMCLFVVRQLVYILSKTRIPSLPFSHIHHTYPGTYSYSRAYLQHLMKAGELLGGLLVSQHNVYFMNELMTAIRRAVREGTLDEEEKKWVAPGLRSWDFQTQEASARSTGGGRQGCWDARANVNGTGGAGGVTEKIKRASEGRAGVLRS